MNQTVYAIVVTYNGAKWVDKCFSSLVNSSIPLKILAIDNSSSDGTPTLIREKFPQVEVIETGKNLGFGKANNIGLRRVVDENADYAFIHHIILTYPKYISKRTAIKHSFWHLTHSFYKFTNNIKSTIIFILYEFPEIWKKNSNTILYYLTSYPKFYVST